MGKLDCKFDESDKLECKFDKLAKLECKFDELAKLRMSSISWISYNSFRNKKGFSDGIPFF